MFIFACNLNFPVSGHVNYTNPGVEFVRRRSNFTRAELPTQHRILIHSSEHQ